MSKPAKALRIAINGFGRIGRHVLRAWLERGGDPALQFVAVNDVASGDMLAHLLSFDSTHGRFPGTVHWHGDQLEVQMHGQPLHRIRLLQEAQPEALPWEELGVDLVLECTGLFRSREGASRHLYAGAKRVMIGAAPFDQVDAAIVYGVNHETLAAEHRIISSVSCTTQALVPLIQLLDQAYGIESALMTEIHAVTTDQSVLDHAHRDPRRARAAGFNIIPTTSSALGALKRVLPQMENRIDGYSIRVPTLNVAAIDVSAVLNREVTVEELNALFVQASRKTYAGIMGVTDRPLVSSDFNHQPESLVVDMLQTMSVGRQVKILAWYDNEWGYANRLLDLCGVIGRL